MYDVSKIKYSIIIPVYNSEQYIKQCIESILDQDLKSWEVIIIDDGSDDKSKDIIFEYSEKYSNIKYHYQDNAGLSSARNSGIAHARGDYIVFLDSDDFMAENALVSLDEAVVRYKEPDCIVNLFQRITKDEKEPVIYNYYYDSEKYEKYNPCSVISDLLVSQKIIICACMFVVKRILFEDFRLDFKKGIFHEDVLWVPQMIMKISCLGYNNKPLFVYRADRAESITNNRNIKKVTDRLDIADYYVKSFQERKIYRLSPQVEMLNLILAGIEYSLVQEIIDYRNCPEYMHVLGRIKSYVYLLKSASNRNKIMYILCRLFGVETTSKVFRILKGILKR